jgi:transcriptional regulator with XRE-family HTH domain
MYTELGKELRNIRLEHNELLLDMATKLHMGSAALSSIEHGKIAISEEFLTKISKIYNLNSFESKRLYTAYKNSKNLSETDTSDGGPIKYILT